MKEKHKLVEMLASLVPVGKVMMEYTNFYLGLRTQRFTPGFNMVGFQPFGARAGAHGYGTFQEVRRVRGRILQG